MLTLNDGRKELYQWDTGRTATVDIECDVVHFANLKYGESLAVEVKAGEVSIPNKLLMSGAPIYCWAFAKDYSGSYTKKEQTLSVTKRAKPSDYVYTETDVITVKTAVENALQEAKESGDFKGEKGDKGDKGDKGEKGDKGNDGYTPQKGVDYFTTDDIASLNIPSVDQTYTSDSENAQSGKAVAEAVEPKLDKPSMPPTVGSVLKVLSVNEDGTFACEWANADYELIEDYTAETDIEMFSRILYPDGNSYDLNKILMDIQLSAIEDSGLTVQMYVKNPISSLIYIGRIAKSSGNNRIIFKAEYFAKSFFITESVFAQNDFHGNKQILTSAPIYGKNIKGIMTTFSIPKDSRIRIYGVRA